MSEGFTECPDCGVAFDTIDEKKAESGVIQQLTQQCPSCELVERVGIVNYPDGMYHVVANAIESDEECAECGDDPDWRTQRLGRSVVEYCHDCMPGYLTAPFRKI